MTPDARSRGLGGWDTSPRPLPAGDSAHVGGRKSNSKPGGRGVCGESREEGGTKEEGTRCPRADGRSSSWGSTSGGEFYWIVGATGAFSSQDLASDPGKTRWKIERTKRKVEGACAPEVPMGAHGPLSAR